MTMSVTAQRSGPEALAYPRARLVWLDFARTLALLAMIVFHFARDLEIFGYIDAGTTLRGGWALSARWIAGTFIILSGISFVLAHGTDMRWQAWARRVFQITFAAALVSAATYIAFPDRFVYFGILHLIAVSSILGVVLLHLPGLVLLAMAGLILLMQSTVPDLFHTPWLAWTGLSASVRPSLDFLPLVPWFSGFVAGMAAAKLIPLAKLDVRGASRTWLASVSWPGRHSLAVYLLHQPLLLGSIWLFTKLPAW